jgi:ribonuclease P protein component
MEKTMTPPEAEATGDTAPVAAAPPADFVCVLQTLQHRPDYLRAASARRQSTPGFLLQARFRADDAPLVRVGFTASKKIGNAVFRNRAKRRMRALARAVLPTGARPGWDYVLVARPGVTVDRTFALLLDDLAGALRQVHKGTP